MPRNRKSKLSEYEWSNVPTSQFADTIVEWDTTMGEPPNTPHDAAQDRDLVVQPEPVAEPVPDLDDVFDGVDHHAPVDAADSKSDVSAASDFTLNRPQKPNENEDDIVTKKLFLACISCGHMIMFEYSESIAVWCDHTNTMAMTKCNRCEGVNSPVIQGTNAKVMANPFTHGTVNKVATSDAFKKVNISPTVIEQLNAYKIASEICRSKVVLLVDDGLTTFVNLDGFKRRISCEYVYKSVDTSLYPIPKGTSPLLEYVIGGFM